MFDLDEIERLARWAIENKPSIYEHPIMTVDANQMLKMIERIRTADELEKSLSELSFTHSDECETQDYYNNPYSCICGLDEVIRDWKKYHQLLRRK